MEILNATFFRYALISAVIIGGLCAFLGVYIILRRIVFIGLALSEVAALGVALGLILGWRADVVSLIATLAVTLFFWRPHKRESSTNESLIGFVYITAAALGILLIARTPAIKSANVDLIGGNILYTTTSDIWMLSVMAAVMIVLHIALAKEFLFVSFDKETAHTLGLKTNFYDFILYISIGVVIALSMRTGGVLFVFGSLIIPGLIGLTLFTKMKYIFISAVCIAAFSAIIGIFLSYFWDLPSSPTILCVYGIIFIIANLVKRILNK